MAPPERQIRALYDQEAITVYQAYSSVIAEPAVREQKLSASPEFKPTRMTWVKPSWCWMMYVDFYTDIQPPPVAKKLGIDVVTLTKTRTRNEFSRFG